MESLQILLSYIFVIWLFYMIYVLQIEIKRERDFYKTKEGYKIFLEKEKTKRILYENKYHKGRDKS